MADFKIDVYHHLGEPTVSVVLTRLTDIGAVVQRIEEKQVMASEVVELLRSEVAEMRTAQDAAAALLTGLSAQILANAEDPAALRQLASDIDASTNALAAAVVANTPQASG